MKRIQIEQVERRLLFAGVTINTGPADIETVTGQFAPDATAAIGSSGNSLLVITKSTGVFGKIIDPSGAAVGSEFNISPAGQAVSFPSAVAATAMPNGNVAVAYQGQTFGSPSDYGNIELVVVAPDGTLPLSPVQVAPSIPGFQNNPSLAAFGNRIGVAFTSAANLGTVNSSVYFDEFSGDGLAEIGSPTQLDVPPPNPPHGIVNDHPSVAADPAGDFLAVWNKRVYDDNLATLESSVFGVTINGSTGAASAPTGISVHSGNLAICGSPYAVGSTAGFGCAFAIGDFDANFALTDSSVLFCSDISGDGSADVVTTTVAHTDASARVGVSGCTVIPSSVDGEPPIAFMCISSGVSSSSGVAVSECEFGMCSCDPDNSVQVVTGNLFSAKTDSQIVTGIGVTGEPYVYAYNTSVADDFTSAAVHFYGGSIAVPVHASGKTVSVGDASEGDVTSLADVVPLAFPITVIGSTGEAVTVRFRTLDSDSGTTAGGSYTPTDVTLTIPAGSGSTTAHVPVTAVGALAGNVVKVEITSLTSGVTVGVGTATGQLPRLISSTLFTFSVSLGQTDLRPGGKTTATLKIVRSATAPSGAPKTGSGEFKLNIAEEGGGTETISDAKVKLNLAKSGEQTVSLKVNLPTVLGDGTRALSATFAGDAKSGITAANSQVSVTPGNGQTTAEITVANVFTSGTTLLAGDADGTAAKFSIKGPGQGRVRTNDDGTVDLVFTGTTAATTVSISAPSAAAGSGGNGRFDVRNITTDGPIGKVSASCVDVGGNITLGGPITNGAFGNVRDGRVITLPTSSTVATLTFLSLANVTFNSGQPIGNLTVKDWTDTDSTADVLTAPSIVKLMVTGNFEAGLAVAGTVVNLVVGGTLGGTTAHTVVAANFGKVAVGSVRNTKMFAGVASAGLPTSAADFTSASSNIVGFSMKGTFSNSSIAAKSIGTLALTSVSTASDDTFGVAAEVLKSYSRDKAKKAIPTSPGLVDSAGQFSVRTLS